jgi:hypothetical protein
MRNLRVHVRGISILGAIITVLLLFGISCGGGGTTTTDVGKSVSGAYDITGVVLCDHNDDFTYGNDGDHACAGHPVHYKLNGQNQLPVYCDEDGKYTIVRNNVGDTAEVWIEPYLTHFAHFFRYTSGSLDWDSRDKHQFPPAGLPVALSFCGSDYEQ